MSNQTLAKKFNELTLESEDHWDCRGNSNSERDYFCTYPAMMVPKMQREMLEVCLNELSEPNPKLLDPFSGSGTILVEGMLKGLDVVGIDINPLAVLLCKIKTTIINVEDITKQAELLKVSIDNSKNIPNHGFKGIAKWFTPKAIADLSVIRASIITEPKLEFRRFFWATFCEVVRLVSNSRDCTYKLHIKDKDEIDTYDKDAIKLFKEILRFNIGKYSEFYDALKAKGHIRKKEIAYKGSVKVILGNAISYLNHTKQKFDLVFTSPPYGDNHTTVSYGQYSIMPLRWIDCKDIDSSINEKILDTLYEIDNISLGEQSADKYITKAKNKILKKSSTLGKQVESVEKTAPKQKNKIIAFYDDYDRFLCAISRKVKINSISVWTLEIEKLQSKKYL